MCSIHQFYNLLIAYKVTYTRFANILEVARAEQTERLLQADFHRGSLLAPPRISQRGSRFKYEKKLRSWGVTGPLAFLSFLLTNKAIIFSNVRNQLYFGGDLKNRRR